MFWKPFIGRSMWVAQSKGLKMPAPTSTCGRSALSSLRPKAGPCSMIGYSWWNYAHPSQTPLSEENSRDLQPLRVRVRFFIPSPTTSELGFQLASCVRWKSWCSISPLKFLAGVCWIPPTKYFVIRMPRAIAVILHLWGREGSVSMTVLISSTSRAYRPNHSCPKGLCLMHEL